MSESDISGVLAGLASSDLERSVAWMTKVVGAEPDSFPMDGLADWYLDAAGTIQVTVDAARAGGSTITLVVDDIEATAGRLRDAGIDLAYDDTTSTKVRFGQLKDPDGNSITVVENK